MNSPANTYPTRADCEAAHKALKRLGQGLQVAQAKRDEAAAALTETRLQLAGLEREAEQIGASDTIAAGLLRAREIAEQQPRLRAFETMLDRLLVRAEEDLAALKVQGFRAELEFADIQHGFLTGAYVVAADRFAAAHCKELVELSRLEFLRRRRGAWRRQGEGTLLEIVLASIAKRLATSPALSFTLTTKDTSTVDGVPTGVVQLNDLNPDREIALDQGMPGHPKLKADDAQLVQLLVRKALERDSKRQEADAKREPEERWVSVASAERTANQTAQG